MNASISVICYKYKTLKNGECALMLRITKDRKSKYQSLGISIPPQFWDFTKNQPKRNCPNKDAILRLISEKTKQYQEQLIEFKAENKDFTATALIQKVDKPTKRMTIGELFFPPMTTAIWSAPPDFSAYLQGLYGSKGKSMG